MTKQKNTIIIHILLVLPILIFSMTISQASNSFPLLDEGNLLLEEPSGISNFQVHSACSDAIKGSSLEVKSMGSFVCRMTQDMAYEHNNYHQYFIRYFTEKEMEEPLYMLEGYSVTGCDISELSRGEFAGMIVGYFALFEDELEDSFFWTLEKVLKPYCDELRDASIEFYLDENDERSKT